MNPAECAIRPFTIGKKNWIFSKSQAGASASASANLYSLIETAKANEVYDYLTRVFTDLLNARNIEDIKALLPWKMILG
ncbi:hypothetical protein GCM10025791_38300 [Halioxenophilus aromaticivorans]|jgi:transposase|uniref:Transposase IS66 C-terminal domain-containing protein n=1 Tax=Halioxenophilus aromaticivorans TaxID=1306992 RepID=A0AAV3U7A0_9ALTE|tara:strand:- start:1656 stop:1892 length:237 start_codon:yes stop_codon:yes gene_type:complete